MKLTSDLQELVQKKIEEQADPKASAALRLLLAQIPDRREREQLASACYTFAGAWSDAALLIGFRMAQDPGAWLFSDDGE